MPLPTTTGWYQIPSSTLRSVSPPDNFGGFTYPFQAQFHSHINAWNSGVMDTRRNRLITWGGGHNDYKGNDIYALDLNSLTVARIFGPTVPVTAAGISTETLGTNIPNSRHTYAALQYMANVDRLFSYGGALSANGGFSKHTWTYDFSTGTWLDMLPTGTIPSPDACCPVATGYDPNTGKVFMTVDALYAYTFATNSWARVNNSSVGGYYVNGVVDPINKKFVIVGGGNVYYYDISGPPYTMTSLATSGASSIVSANAPGLAFDPSTRKIIAWNEGNTIYSLDLSSGVWTPIAFSGGPPARDVGAVGTFGRFAYSPKSRGFVLINSVDNDAYFLRTTALPVTTQIPNLWDEMQTYTSWGWTWNTNQEPSYANVTYSVSNPDIHGETEGDDLWAYLAQFQRTGQPGFIDRANAWAAYEKNSYAQCIGTSGRTLCSDRDQFGLDHVYGWGLIDYYNYTGDASYLTAAINVGAMVEFLWSPSTTFGCLPSNGCLHYGTRQLRQLILITRLAEATGDSRWTSLRDRMISVFLASPMWDAARGTYFLGDTSTDSNVGAGAYAAGARIALPSQLGILVEAFAQAYRTTGNTVLRDRIILIANFVNTYGLDSTYNYTGSVFGIVNGQPWHNYHNCPGGPPCTTCGTGCTFWDPVYTTSLVNTLVYGYKYSGNAALLARAKVFFNRGTKGVYGSVSARTATDTAVGHFIDTTFDSSSGNFYLGYNKGELQYTYLIFENGGSPTIVGIIPPSDTTPPAPPPSSSGSGNLGVGSSALSGFTTLGVISFNSPMSLIDAFSSNKAIQGETVATTIFSTHENNAAGDIIYIGDATLTSPTNSGINLLGPNQVFKLENTKGLNSIPLGNIKLDSNSSTAKCRVSILVS